MYIFLVRYLKVTKEIEENIQTKFRCMSLTAHVLCSVGYSNHNQNYKWMETRQFDWRVDGQQPASSEGEEDESPARRNAGID